MCSKEVFCPRVHAYVLMPILQMPRQETRYGLIASTPQRRTFLRYKMRLSVVSRGPSVCRSSMWKPDAVNIENLKALKQLTLYCAPRQSPISRHLRQHSSQLATYSMKH